MYKTIKIARFERGNETLVLLTDGIHCWWTRNGSANWQDLPTYGVERIAHALKDGCSRWWTEDTPLIVETPVAQHCKVEVVDGREIEEILPLAFEPAGDGLWRWVSDVTGSPVTVRLHTNIVDAFNELYRIWGHRPIVMR
jgi:hypothetical protein